MKLTRTRAALRLIVCLASGAAGFPSAPAAQGLRIGLPPPGAALSENYPAASQPPDSLAGAVLQAINRERTERGVTPVVWDEAAARVASAFCAAQVVERTHGHFLTNGVPPYARTGFAGVFGYQSENSASWVSSGDSFLESAIELALAAHRGMMEEKPPKDGHRRAILDPNATHVGVGWTLAGGRLQIAEEFLERHLARLSLRTDPTVAVVRVEGAARAPMYIRYVTLAREPLPATLTAAEANARTTYRYPAATEAYVPEGYRQLQVVGTLTRDRLQVGRDRAFSFSFAPEKAGLWTLVFWVAKRGDDQARPGGSAVVRAEP